MEFTEKDIQILEQYWQNHLPDTDKQQLEDRLNTDMEFRREAQKLQLITEGVNVLKQRQLKQHLKELDNTLPPTNFTNNRNWLRFLLAALAIALAAFVVWYFTIKEDEPQLSPMIAAYFEPYPALGITMGETSEAEAVKKNALIQYAQKDYTQAIVLLQKSFLETNDTMLLFYQGIANLAIGESLKAQNIFEQVQNTHTISQEATYWYLALSLIANKQNDKAIDILETKISGKYAPKARLLLQEINKK